MTLTRGLDVSHYQGAVNWKARRDQYNLSFGAAKCTEGTTFTDSQFAANWAGIKAAGLRRIAYHYARPEAGSALAQAKRLVAVANPQAAPRSVKRLIPGPIRRALGVSVPEGDAVCLDLEVSQLSQSETNAWMRAFGDALRTLAPGVTTFVYLGGYAANGSGQGSVGHFDRWWYPRYPGSTSWPSTYSPRIDANTTGWKAPPAPHIWQFTPDMAGMDADVSNLTIAQLFSQTDSGGLSVADVDTILARIDGVAANVLALATITSSRVGDPSTPPGEAHSLATWISAIDANAYAAKVALAGLTPEAIADAVIARLPAAEQGVTADQVKQAVKDALREGVGA